MIYLVVSDLHLGKGKFLKNGQLNILEDFFEDDRFEEFLEFYSTDENYLEPVHLVLGGDILNLIQIDIEGVFSYIIDDELTCRQIDAIASGHPIFFRALEKFMQAPNKKITYIIGNHDSGIAFEGAQEKLRQLISPDIQFTDELDENGIHVEHGHRFEAINTVAAKNFFVTGPQGKKILNLPWGSLFCIGVLPLLKKERPHIDKVRPMSAYITWCLIHDTAFFFRLIAKVVGYVIQTSFDTYVRQNRNFKTSMAILKQITIYPKYEKKAKAILRKKKHLHTVIMGHTHLQEWRRFPEGRYYFNTGTWNPIPSMDAGLHESAKNLTYCLLEVHEKSGTLRKGALNVWQGKWRPFREEVHTA